MRASLLGVLLLSGCLDFAGAEAEFCAKRPDLCGDAGGPPADAGRADAGRDAGPDSGQPDASVDAGEADGGDHDGGEVDAGEPDGGPAEVDAGPLDAGPEDAGAPDAGPVDAGPPVCGDLRREPPEVCDDGNTAAGDGCDPTCRYFNRLTHLSGMPGSQNFADSVVGVAARFAYVTSLTSDGTSLFAADKTARAIREIDPVTGATTTMFGGPGIEELPDGGTLRGPVDVEYHALADGSPGALYILDQSPTGTDRVFRVDFFDPPGFRTRRLYRSDITGGRAVAAGFFGPFERLITFTDFGLQESRVLAGGGFGSSGTLANTTQLESLAGSSCHDVTFIGGSAAPDGGYASSNYLVTCETALLRVSAAGGAPTVLTGTTSAGCVDGASSAARLTRALRLAWEGGNTAVFVDVGCNRVRRVNLTTGAVSAVAGQGQSSPVQDGPNAQARFSALSAITSAAGLVFASENPRVRRIDSTTTRVLAGDPLRPGQVFGFDAGYIGSGGITLDGQSAYTVVPFQQLVVRTSLTTGEATPVTFLQADPMGQFPGPMALVGQNLFVAYASGNVRRVDLTRLPPDGAVPDAGAIDRPFAGRGLPAEALTSLTTDGTTMWATSAQNRLVRLGSDGGITPVAGTLNGMAVVDGVGVTAEFAGPTALTYAAGALWFLDGAPLLGRGTVLRRYDFDGGVVSTVLGVSGEARRVDGVGRMADGGVGPARLAGAFGLAGNGTTLLIADVGQQSVLQGEVEGPTLRLYDVGTGVLSTAAGQPGNASSLPGLGRATLVSRPTQLAWDPSRRRFVIFDPGENVFLTFE